MAKTSKMYEQFLGGPNGHASPFVMQDHELVELNGAVLNEELGAIVQDPGYAVVNAAAPESGKPVRAIYDFQQSTSVQKLLVTVNNSGDSATQLFYNNAGTWTEITQAEVDWTVADVDVDFETFIGYCFMVGVDANGNFIDTASLTGTTFSTSTNVTDAPQGKFIVRYLDRLYILNCKVGSTEYPYRAYRSSVPVAGAITWDTSGTSEDFIDFDYGAAITGGVEAFDNLLVFTREKTFRYNQSVKKKLWGVGCVNHKTIAEAGGYLFFVSKEGVQYSASGEKPTNISGKIKDLIKNADVSVMRAAGTEEEYHLYLGTTSMGGIAYTNCLATLDVATSTWRWRELGHAMQALAKYEDSFDDRLIMATSESSGQVYNKSKWTDASPSWTDAGEAINAGFTLVLDHCGSPNVEKQPTRFTAWAAAAMGLKLEYRVLNDKTRHVDREKAKWNKIGELKNFMTVMDVNDGESGYFIQIKGKTKSTHRGFSFYGLMMEYDEVGIPNSDE